MSQGPEFETPPSDEIRRATEFADRIVTSATAALGYIPWVVRAYSGARVADLETPSLLPVEGSLSSTLGRFGMTEYGSPVTITDFGEDATSPLLLSMGIPHNVICADGTVLPEGNIRVGRDGSITREVFNQDTLKLETHIVTPEEAERITGRLNPSTLRPRFGQDYNGQRALFGGIIDMQPRSYILGECIDGRAPGGLADGVEILPVDRPSDFIEDFVHYPAQDNLYIPHKPFGASGRPDREYYEEPSWSKLDSWRIGDGTELPDKIISPEPLKFLKGILGQRDSINTRPEEDNSVAVAIAGLRGLNPTLFVDPDGEQEGVVHVPVDLPAEPAADTHIEDLQLPSDKTLDETLAKLDGRIHRKASADYRLFWDELVKRPMLGPDFDIIPYPLDPDHLPGNDEPDDQSGPSNIPKPY